MDLDVVAVRKRADSNVRPRGHADPANCGIRLGVYDRQGNCRTCGFREQVGFHCHLLEACDQCTNPEDPCPTREQVDQLLER